MNLRICPWKHGKQWVYSITYDEGLADLHRFAVPLHDRYGLPGHVEMVVGQLGQVRDIGTSSYNGYRHMEPGELRQLLARGWGVGNHSWSHELITPELVDRELRQAREVLEAAIGRAVHLYCAPGDNSNMSKHVLEACRQLGYLGAMSLTDALNRPDDELFWINRTALHDQYYPPFYSEFDPYRNIRHAQATGGWIIDYCHCPLEEPVHRHKDCSRDQLQRRFEAVLQEGGDAVWCAAPEEVMFYHQCRRQVRIQALEQSAARHRYRLSLDDISPRVECRDLTLEATVPGAWCAYPRIDVDGRQQPAEVVRPGVLRFTVTVHQATEIAIGEPGHPAGPVSERLAPPPSDSPE